MAHGIGQIAEGWMTVAQAASTFVYPSDGVGGVTATAADAITYGKRVLVTGYTIDDHILATGFVQIGDGEATNIQIFKIPATAGEAEGVFFPIAHDGVDQNAGTVGISAKWRTQRVDFKVYFQYWP